MGLWGGFRKMERSSAAGGLNKAVKVTKQREKETTQAPRCESSRTLSTLQTHNSSDVVTPSKGSRVRSYGVVCNPITPRLVFVQPALRDALRRFPAAGTNYRLDRWTLNAALSLCAMSFFFF